MQSLSEALGTAPSGAVLDHVGIAVRDLAVASRTYSALFPGAFCVGPAHEVPAQGECASAF